MVCPATVVVIVLVFLFAPCSPWCVHHCYVILDVHGIYGVSVCVGNVGEGAALGSIWVCSVMCVCALLALGRFVVSALVVDGGVGRSQWLGLVVCVRWVIRVLVGSCRVGLSVWLRLSPDVVGFSLWVSLSSSDELVGVLCGVGALRKCVFVLWKCSMILFVVLVCGCWPKVGFLVVCA